MLIELRRLLFDNSVPEKPANIHLVSANSTILPEIPKIEISIELIIHLNVSELFPVEPEEIIVCSKLDR